MLQIWNRKCNSIFGIPDFEENQCFSKSENSRILGKSMLSRQKILDKKFSKKKETTDTFKYQRKLALTNFWVFSRSVETGKIKP